MNSLLSDVEALFFAYLKLNLNEYSKLSLSEWQDFYSGYEGAALLGQSREGHRIFGFDIGDGSQLVSLIAGCHADEPVGPLHLNVWLKFLEDCKSDETVVAFLSQYRLLIVPNLNPDGALANEKWWRKDYLEKSNLSSYLKSRERELPGEDIEFGFPAMRPENKAVSDWWVTILEGLGESGSQVKAHLSLHGMGFSAGPWFLLEKSWDDLMRLDSLKKNLANEVRALGCKPHDIERMGEKGFYRLGKGFCSRPDSVSMKKHFVDLGDVEMADKFELSSMECVRRIFGDVFTAVSEMPLFVLPGVAESLGPPDPVAVLWRTRLSEWELELSLGESEEEINKRAWGLGVEMMPLHTQIHFQFKLIMESVKVVSGHS
jgi:hypothetical protein